MIARRHNAISVHVKDETLSHAPAVLFLQNTNSYSNIEPFTLLVQHIHKADAEFQDQSPSESWLLVRSLSWA